MSNILPICVYEFGEDMCSRNDAN